MFKLEIRDMQASESQGKLTGYATVFRVVNPYYNEVIDAGAFDKTLQETGGKVALHADHQHWIGMTTGASADRKGLLFDAEFAFDVQAARERWALARMAFNLKRPAGLSQTFMAVLDKMKDGIRHVTELKWLAVSVEAPDFQSVNPALVTAMRSNIASYREAGIWTPETEALSREALSYPPEAAPPTAEPLNSTRVISALDSLLTKLRAA